MRWRVNKVFAHWRKRIVECDGTDAEMTDIAAKYPRGGSARFGICLGRAGRGEHAGARTVWGLWAAPLTRGSHWGHSSAWI